ncbi:uncharacterized protein LOC111887118 [Lactuca sativa]|uniref:Uncharacterized protein n=1 Tax=Lactuca sativa TaxID=4236 RepID=A0A9R1USV4_LACSA|nr:uncharacterized protein LOC111887118 [Lactuca sativa]KAJ0192492.1 hypothetical protein LSAT_V11C800421370 [Lactuca sativa]
MAQELADGEFWLPPEFLNDEDILMDFIPGKPNPATPTGVLNKGSYSFGSYGPNSDLSSPVESVMGSTETESDEEDYLNCLSQKFAKTTLQDDFRKADANFNYENNHSKATRVMAGSPQSTLCGCKMSSSRGSPNCPSPPATAALNRNEASWDLLYAAAGEVARMRMVEEAASRYYNQNKNYMAQQAPRRTSSPNLNYQQLQVAQFQQLKQQQMAKQHQYLQLMQQNRTRNDSVNGRPVAPPASAWPTPQQSQQQPQQRPPGSGMRAVFLGNLTTKRESTGTGVFLPRQIGAPTEPLKKRGCSTVLLPDRVVQALNLNLEAMEAESKLQSRCNGGPLASDYDAEMMYRSSVMMAQQRRNTHRQQPASKAEFRLPQEWTY